MLCGKVVVWNLIPGVVWVAISVTYRIYGYPWSDHIKTLPLLLLPIASSYLLHRGFLSGFTVRRFIQHLASTLCAIYRGRKQYTILRKAWNDSKNVQAQNLNRILKRAESTVYGIDHGLRPMSVETFRNGNTVPITKYGVYRDYAARAETTEDVMFPGKPVHIGITSGTTGACTTHPKSDQFVDSMSRYLGDFACYNIYSNYPSCLFKKTISVDVYYDCRITENGYNKSPVSWMFLKHSPSYTIPEEGFYMHTRAAIYINLLLSMKETNVGIITALFSASILMFFKAMEDNWASICDDIEHGTISNEYQIPLEIVNKLQEKLQPDPKRADELRSAFLPYPNAGANLVGIARRIWPELSLSVVITSGAFKPAANICSNIYLRGVPNYSKGHGSTEAMVGVNYYQERIDPIYCLISSINFYELLPLDGDGKTTILPEEAKVDKEYELVITTPDGLYRYKTTDVIKACGLRGSALTYQFSQRVGDFLSIDRERTPVSVIEGILHSLLGPPEYLWQFTCSLSTDANAAVGAGTNLVGPLLQDNTRYIQRYWVFVELYSTNFLPPDFSTRFEQELRNTAEAYNAARTREIVGEAEIVQVGNGTFDYQLRPVIMEERRMFNFNQYKTPRIVQNHNYLQILFRNKKTQ